MSRQEQYRKSSETRRIKMKELGFVRKEVWIRPDHSENLKDIEHYFRQPGFKVYRYTGSPGLSIESLNKKETENEF
jgi:hypothetical protein